MIHCLIIDDDPVAINLLKHFIESTDDLNLVESFTNPIQGLNYLKKNTALIDLIFLDVEMPEMSGLEFLETAKDLPPVILTTSKEKYALEAFEHQVNSFLVKPIEYSKFSKAIDRIITQQKQEKNKALDYVFIKENGVLSKVMHQDIRFCEALGDYVKLHVKDRKHVVNSTMKNLEDKLKTNKQFVRIHRSYIINLNFLENFDAETATVSGTQLPIGNKYKTDLQARLNII